MIKIGFMDTKIFNPNRYIVNSIYKAASSEADNFDFEIVFCTYSDIAENVKSRNIDVLILLDGSGLNSNFFELISKYVPILVWTFDDPYDLENTLQSIDFVTRFYTNDYGSLQYYKEKTSYLPLAVDETIWTPNGIEQEYKYDFSFIGTAWPNRIRTLSKISSHLENRKNFICLPNIIGLTPDSKPESINNFIKSRIPLTQVREISSRSKVNLIMGRDFSLGTSYPSVSKGLQPRLFETILTGQKIWVDEITYQASNLEENKFYLDIPQEVSELEIVMNENLKSIISKLKEQVLKENTYRNRVVEIFKDVKKLKSVLTNSNIKHTVTRSKPKVLIVNNLDYNSINSGGSNLYAFEIEQSLKELDFDIHSLFMSQDQRFLELNLGESIEKVNLSRVRDMTQFNNEEVERIFTGYLFQYDYDLIIFNHLINLPLTLPSLAKAIGKKCVYVAHDWYLLCDIHNLYTNFAGYCGFLEKSDLDCDSCLRQQFGFEKGAKKIREKVVNELIKSIDSFVVPSEFSKQSLINKLKIEIDDIQVIQPYSSPFVKNNGLSTKNLKRSLYFIGSASAHKGFLRFIQLCHKIDYTKYDLYVFTNFDENNPESLKKNHSLGEISLIHYDGMKESKTNLEAMLSKYELNFAYLASEWPETYQITIDEVSNISDLIFIGNYGAPPVRLTEYLREKVVTIYQESDDEIIDILRNHTPKIMKNTSNFVGSRFKSDIRLLISNLDIKVSSEQVNSKYKALPSSFTHRNFIENSHFHNWEFSD